MENYRVSENLTDRGGAGQKHFKNLPIFAVWVVSGPKLPCQGAWIGGAGSAPLSASGLRVAERLAEIAVRGGRRQQQLRVDFHEARLDLITRTVVALLRTSQMQKNCNAIQIIFQSSTFFHDNELNVYKDFL